MIFIVFLLIVSVQAAQTSVGGKQVKLEQCNNTESCVWREGKLVYDVQKAKQTERTLYYVESYTFMPSAVGKMSFTISENRRKYYPWKEYSDEKLAKKVLGTSGGYDDRVGYDVNAPTVVNNKVQVNKFPPHKRDNPHNSPHAHSWKIAEEYRMLDSSYSCADYGGKYYKTKCSVEIYLMTFTVPFEARTTNKNKTCECKDDGTLTMKYYPDVVVTQTTSRP